MPELPEVELAARSLRGRLLDRHLAAVEVVDPKLLAGDDPAAWSAALSGRRIEGVERRAKYLVVRAAGGWAIVLHLRMTGRFVAGAAAEPLGHPVRLALGTAEGTRVFF